MSPSLPACTRWLWHAWRGNRRQACLNAVSGLAAVAVSLGSVWAVQRAIDIAAHQRQGGLYAAVAVMAVLVAADFGINIGRVWIKNILGVRAQNRMQRDLLARLLLTRWQGRGSMHSGDVINRLELDVRTVVTFLTETLPGTLSTLAMFAGAFIYLAQMDTALALITVGILPLFIIVSRVYVVRMRQFTRGVRQTDSQVQSILQETVQHQMLIKTLESGPQMLSRLDDTHQTLRSQVRRRTRFSIIAHLILNTGFSLGYLIAFLWCAIRMNDGQITFGAMTAFLQLVFRIQNPARDLTRLAPAFVSVFTAAERLMQLEETPLEEQGHSTPLAGPCGIRLTDISFAYDDEADGHKVIDRLSFDFLPGHCTAILGHTGAGKTTLIRLLLGLIRPTDGKAVIYEADGAGPMTHPTDQEKATYPLSPLTRCNFVYVPQGNTLLSGTIRDNLLLAAPEATDEAMREALNRACADFVLDLPDGLDTRIAEVGGGLSEGQAQRIAIARALLRHRPIVLLDEATSALDPATERQLLANIMQQGDATIIFITHRPAVVEYCDDVLRV